VALFERFTVCSAKMAEPIDGKASNRLRYTLSVDLLLECAEWLAGVQTDKLGLPLGLYGTGKRVRR